MFTPIDTAAGEDDEPKSKLFFEGVMGMFLGGDDRTFAVLESRKIGADNIAMYAVSPEMSEESLLGYTYVPLDTGDSVATLWAGPPSTVMLEEAEYDEEGGLVEREVDGGLGMALVCTAQGNLLLVQLPDVSDTPADAELLAAAVQHEMQLLDGERILQVCPASSQVSAACRHHHRPAALWRTCPMPSTCIWRIYVLYVHMAHVPHAAPTVTLPVRLPCMSVWLRVCAGRCATLCRSAAVKCSPHPAPACSHTRCAAVVRK